MSPFKEEELDMGLEMGQSRGQDSPFVFSEHIARQAGWELS